MKETERKYFIRYDLNQIAAVVIAWAFNHSQEQKSVFCQLKQFATTYDTSSLDVTVDLAL